MNRNVGTWDPEGEKSVPHAEVVAVAALDTDELPDGAVQMSWTDATGFTHVAHLVQWWRLDRQGIGPDIRLDVDVQARQRRDLSCPPHHVSAQLVATGNPTDQAQVMIGDPYRVGSWAFGVLFYGAHLLRTSVLLEPGE